MLEEFFSLVNLTIFIPKQNQEKVNIGVIMPLTGFLANVGIDTKNAIDLSFSDLDASKDVELIYEDDACDSAKALTAYKKLVDVNATIGNIHGFSSHSDCNETITHLKNCKNPAKGEDFSGIFLVHGEKQSLIDLKQELNNVGYQNVVIAEPEKKYDLMGMLK